MRCVAVAFVLALFVPSVLTSAERGPSTAEERAQAVRLAHALEADPLAPRARDARQWLVVWLASVPDITVSVCGAFMKPVLESKKNYGPEIFTQSMFSAAAFVIEHPNQKDDEESKFLAGVEGSLKVYESIRTANPKIQWPVLDDLIARREAGTLRAYVKEKMADCKPR